MRIPLVDLRAQHDPLRDELDQAVRQVVDRSAFIKGPFVQEFEEHFAAYCGVEHCVGVGNGTDALYIVLRALGIGPGDEVITAANTFIASSEAISLTGARVVFADCLPDTHTIDPAAVESAITPRTKAILPVHLFGHPADMEALAGIAQRHGLLLVEDAAQAHGAQYLEKRTGALGNAACFSFFPGKNLGAMGDGGAIVTADSDLARTCRMIANHGRMGKYAHEFEGVNSRLDGLQAAILDVKLRHLDRWNDERRAQAALYRDLLDGLPLELPVEKPGYRHVYHLYVVKTEDRDSVRTHLKDMGVDTGVHYPDILPALPPYVNLGWNAADFPVASSLSPKIMSLPVYPGLTPSMQSHVADALGRVLEGSRG